jgi:hypothetical protein
MIYIFTVGPTISQNILKKRKTFKIRRSMGGIAVRMPSARDFNIFLMPSNVGGVLL